MRNLMWFREHDLRVRDNTALYHASLSAHDGLIAVFLISPEEWQDHDMAPIRQDFILHHLKTLQTELAELNISLLIENVTHKKNIPNFLLKIAKSYHVKKLFFNKQYELNELRRDEKVRLLCESKNISVNMYTDQVIFEPGEILTQKGKFFTVFTPFKNAFLKKLAEIEIKLLPKPKLIPTKIATKIATPPSSARNDNVWKVGEKHARKLLANFIDHKSKDYKINRDYPAIDGTSQLSPYLTSGIISIRECFKKGALNETWISQLIWREFYKHILKNFPRVSMHKPFQLNTEKIHWNTNKKLFDAWKKGQTGIPLVDAGMRQLNQTGWMHNRLRMITAMFLSKNLLIDWRLGEKYFMQNLIDGDLAANNGGWQWCASTGTDAAPYFRIFNPIAQAKKFDPHNEFILRYCPEYNTSHYPKPIINLSESRQHAILIFKEALHYV